MEMLKTLGFGSRKIISQNHKTTGKVVSVKKCRWIKVNTKPVRTHMLDGAMFPHIVHFIYRVNGVDYKGSRFLHYNLPCPHVGKEIIVYYDKNNPPNYAVDF